jgi:uncharacterized membrane protein
MHAAAPNLHFDAWLRPHRSLNRRGLAAVLALAAVPSFVIGIYFLSLGAWPVTGFFGFDVVLLWLAFRLNNRAARECERVRLSDLELTVERHAIDGRAERWSFQPNWLRVAMDDPPRPESRLTLSTHGRSLVIGQFLPPAERLEVADALREALRRWRTPRSC